MIPQSAAFRAELRPTYSFHSIVSDGVLGPNNRTGIQLFQGWRTHDLFHNAIKTQFFTYIKMPTTFFLKWCRLFFVPFYLNACRFHFHCDKKKTIKAKKEFPALSPFHVYTCVCVYVRTCDPENDGCRGLTGANMKIHLSFFWNLVFLFM